MNRRRLALLLSKKYHVPRRKAEGMIQFLLDQTTAALVRGDRLTLHGFGVLFPIRRAVKKVRHPITGKPLTIPARRTVAFRAFPALVKRLKTSIR